jgi:cytochrome c oxidase subunit 1
VSTLEYSRDEAATVAPRVVPRSKGRMVVNWITSTDHKTIGYMYLISSFTFFCIAGVMALPKNKKTKNQKQQTTTKKNT